MFEDFVQKLTNFISFLNCDYDKICKVNKVHKNINEICSIYITLETPGNQ